MLEEPPYTVTKMQAYGLDCALISNYLLHGDEMLTLWDGYVRVPDCAKITHWAKVNGHSMDDVALGGITYCEDYLPVTHEPGMWIGFDTAHPGMEHIDKREATEWVVDLALHVKMAVKDTARA